MSYFPTYRKLFAWFSFNLKKPFCVLFASQQELRSPTNVLIYPYCKCDEVLVFWFSSQGRKNQLHAKENKRLAACAKSHVWKCKLKLIKGDTKEALATRRNFTCNVDLFWRTVVWRTQWVKGQHLDFWKQVTWRNYGLFLKDLLFQWKWTCFENVGPARSHVPMKCMYSEQY